MKITDKTIKKVEDMVIEIFETHAEGIIRAFANRGGEVTVTIKAALSGKADGNTDIAVDISYDVAAKIKDKIEGECDENQGNLPLEGSGSLTIKDMVRGQVAKVK